MRDYPNGGFCFVDLTGLDLTGGAPENFTVKGIHTALKNAIINGKIVIACGMTNGSGNVLLTPVFIGAELDTDENEDEDIVISVLFYDGSAMAGTVKKDDSVTFE